jgi:sugar transferase (PEP-CTERM system associated)
MPRFLGGLTWRVFALLAVDHLLIVGGVLAASVIRLGVDGLQPMPVMIAVLWRASIIAIVLQLMLHYTDLYDPRAGHEPSEVAGRLLQAVAAASVLMAVLYYVLPELLIGRGIAAISALLAFALLLVWRLLIFDNIARHLGPGEHLLIVGMSSAAVELAHELHQRRNSLGVVLVGFIDADENRSTPIAGNPGVVGTIADLPRLVRTRRIDRIVVSLADARGKFAMDELLRIKLNDGVHFDHLASVYERYTGKIAIENLRPSWLIFSEGFRKTRSMAAAKRTADILLASIALLLLGPIMLIVALVTRLSSAGPALYFQERVGQDGKTFTVVKFRSMRQDAEAKTGAVWAAARNDPRVTPVGRVLRRTRLDELPQLWNVLKGEMSFVGPRPERPTFVASLTDQIPFYGQRHAVRPGITGWAQVRHRYGSSVDDAMQKLQYDLYYIKNLSVAFDLFIILETIKTVAVRRGS